MGQTSMVTNMDPPVSAYEDYTGYAPVNAADKNVDINRWQPKYFEKEGGERIAPGCLTPHWGKVKPVALTSSDQFRSPPPPLLGSEQLEKEVKEVVDLQANLSNEEKALVEFMRDGPSSVQQAGHWLKFAMNVSVRDSHDLDEDVKTVYAYGSHRDGCFYCLLGYQDAL